MGNILLSKENLNGEPRPKTWNAWVKKLTGNHPENGPSQKDSTGVVQGTKQLLDGSKEIVNGVFGIAIGTAYFPSMMIIIKSFYTTLAILAVLIGVCMATLWIGQVSPWLESLPDQLTDGINTWLQNQTATSNVSPGSVSASCFVNVAGGCIPTEVDESILEVNLRLLNVDV